MPLKAIDSKIHCHSISAAVADLSLILGIRKSWLMGHIGPTPVSVNSFTKTWPHSFVYVSSMAVFAL